MGLKIITLIKQVPDTQNISGEAMKADGTVNRSALPAITNPEDLNALEAALQIKEKIGATITSITLGPPLAANVLKASLFRGVDDAILITDPKFAASDTLATSYAIKCAVEKIGKFDLIICGRQAIDGDTAQVGPQLAEKLKINQLTSVAEVIEINSKEITVRRAIDGGYEIVRSKFPVLLTVIGEANEPRAPSAKKVMLYKNICPKITDSYDEVYLHPESGNYCTHIKQWNASDINAEAQRTGLSGSPTKVKKIESVVLTASQVKNIANNDAEIGGLVHELIAEHILG